ncbi:hypothetical protein RIF29_28746 [Crotalaria pallida]|uniref:Uncharacterized protein n=1 Tax=Crotalaria pallida TaxID=3830 RepID=A0AAN9HVM0_CROPI
MGLIFKFPRFIDYYLCTISISRIIMFVSHILLKSTRHYNFHFLCFRLFFILGHFMMVEIPKWFFYVVKTLPDRPYIFTKTQRRPWHQSQIGYHTKSLIFISSDNYNNNDNMIILFIHMGTLFLLYCYNIASLKN